MSSKKILIVDDEPDIVEILSYNLKKEGYSVLSASNGKEALEIALKEKPDMVLLDVMMPEMDGIETCMKMRKSNKLQDTIIVFLSARSEEFTQLAAFDAGANDFVTKPIRPKVLIQKISALFDLQKTEKKKEEILIIGNLTIDNNKFVVFLNGQEYELPKKEFQLLYFLASEPNRVFKRDHILSQVWGEDVIVGGRTIDVHIRKLREKLPIDNIKTVKGVGYKFQTEDV